MLIPISPNALLNGYNDTLIETLNELPIYMGGDNSTSPLLAVSQPPTHPANNTVAFFTGQDEYMMTRTYGKWIDQEYIKMRGKEYKSINEIVDYTYSPWRENVLLDGTDGM